jgi:hypothetical protein
MYGSDARFIHSLGFMDNVVDDTVQPDIVEAYGNWHLPVLTDGGVDLMVGQFVTLMGADVIYAPGNMLYSHSYIFNFGIPYKHTGAMATVHVNDQLDVKLGLVAGINTGSFDDNNDAWAFHGGFVWTSPCKTATVAASLHEGPENDGFFRPRNGFNVDPNDDFRHIVDVVTTVKCTPCLTSVTDINFGKDEGFDSEWYGVAQYLVYKINNCLSSVARLEIWRDDDNFAAFKDVSNDGFINQERGEQIDPTTGFASGLSGGGDTTYTSLTLGLNYKPYENLMLRPEVRMDWADIGSTGIAPFDDNSDNNQFTLGFDVIWSF